MSIPEKDDPTKIGIGDESAWPLLSDLDLAICVRAADTVRPTRLASAASYLSKNVQPPAGSHPTASRKAHRPFPTLTTLPDVRPKREARVAVWGEEEFRKRWITRRSRRVEPDRDRCCQAGSGHRALVVRVVPVRPRRGPPHGATRTGRRDGRRVHRPRVRQRTARPRRDLTDRHRGV